MTDVIITLKVCPPVHCLSLFLLIMHINSLMSIIVHVSTAFCCNVEVSMNKCRNVWVPKCLGSEVSGYCHIISYKLLNKNFHYDVRKYSFTACVANIWNSLPDYVVDVDC